MTKWLDTLEGPEAEFWQLPLEQTIYPEETRRFWSLLRTGNATLTLVEDYFDLHADHPAALAVAADSLDNIMLQETDSMGAVEEGIKRVQELLRNSNRI